MLEAPSLGIIRDVTQQRFGKRPCLWQIKITQAFIETNRDIVCIAGTSMGKTMTFWMPLLFKPGLQIIVTPLNQLGRQNVSALAKAGLLSISISSETASWSNFRDIEDMKYRAVIVSPEQLMKPGGEFEKLLRKPLFAQQIIGIIFDEAHCIATWGDFRPEYKELERLRYILPCYVPFMLASATLTEDNLTHVKRLLHMRSDKLLTIQTSVDRANIKLCVRKIMYSLTSYQDLSFLIPDGWKDGDPAPPKFLVFFDDIQDSIAAAKSIQKRLPSALRHKIKWFNSDMTTQFKEDEVNHLISGETWGLCTTESFGMGMDVPDISIVVQWKATCKLATLWQRWGRAVRDRGLQGTAVLFAEKDHFDDVREEKRWRQETKKRKADENVARTATRRRTQLHPVRRQEDGHEWENPEDDSDGDRAEEGDQELKEQLQSKLEGKSGGSTRKKRELEPPMDCLINAHLRDPDHITCDPSNSDGCTRCAPLTPSVCCDIHNPDTLSPNTTSLPSKAIYRSRILKYEMGPREFQLRDALEDWRESVTSRIYGDSTLNDYGPGVTMPDSVLDRIVDCAHHHKVSTTDDLRKETRWSAVDRFGSDVIAIIQRIIPVPVLQPVLTTTRRPQPNLPSTTQSNLPLVARKQPRCSACGIEGHTSKLSP
ncbi:P-loop containing nucleoside triphosphate hydrolase protein [Suillus placidus]|uniref:DNA 3'-5' helicase n=1 Tax=Suillus placidus TaxID=48579 RepID=A0A9P6ZF70_9AGAM|nr:P-loop containing nucleoside triphosphate hydrolase protein [Suillus placidus]